MIYVITGFPGSSMSEKINEITAGKPAFNIEAYKLETRSSFRGLRKDTQFIIIEKASIVHRNSIEQLIYSDYIHVNSRFETPFEMPLPNIIVCSTWLDKYNFPKLSPRFKIEFIKLEDFLF